MLTAVYRYGFNIKEKGEFEIQMPVNAQILHFGSVSGLKEEELSIWARVNPSNEPITRKFRVAGTGHHLDDSVMNHIATAIVDGYVWHLFERA